MVIKGILLAGGRGTRLYPMTAAGSKQLLPVYDKPMIYYPLTTLMLAGIRDILVISTPEDTPRFEEVLGDGAQWGISLSYVVQPEPRGIAEALTLGAEFVGEHPVFLMLGDNVVYGNLDRVRAGVQRVVEGDVDACVFGYPVADPSRYGVVEFDASGAAISLEEKPRRPRSKWAVPGLYVYARGVAARAAELTPSTRGELEITELNRGYLERGQLVVVPLGRGFAWFDTGTPEGLLDAANFVHAVESRQGLVIGSPEEAAVRMGTITPAQLDVLAKTLPQGPYRDYLVALAPEEPGAAP